MGNENTYIFSDMFHKYLPLFLKQYKNNSGTNFIYLKTFRKIRVLKKKKKKANIKMFRFRNLSFEIFHSSAE